MPHKFAIIGGGLTATSMLCQLVDKLRQIGGEGQGPPFELSIVVFEKKDVFGPGLPHSDRYVLPFHITNMCAKDMSVRLADPDDFQNWVLTNSTELQTRHPDLLTAFACPDCRPEQCRHYPRAVMGEYLNARFHEAVGAARKLGVTVELQPETEVIDLAENNQGIRLTARGMRTSAVSVCDVSAVLVATGHWFAEPENEFYFSSPWPAAKLLAGIPAGETVGVIGSSLSAIEVALTLTSEGRFERRPSGELTYTPPRHPREIVFYSRQGLLPRVRGRTGRRPNRYLTCDVIGRMIADNPGCLPLSAVFDLLDKELKAAYGFSVNWRSLMFPRGNATERLRLHIQEASRGDGPEGELIWQTALVEIFPVVRDLYLNLALDERKYFDRRFNTAFFMHAATQPVINAEKLQALMQAGIVSIVKLGSDYRFERDDTAGKFEFIYEGPGGDERRDGYRYVVNARGQPRSVESDPAVLTQNLLRRGLIQIKESRAAESAESLSYKTGSVVVDPETHQVMRLDADGVFLPNRSIFAVGAMTRGQMIDASMAYGITRSTATIAEYLIGELRLSDGQ